MRRGIAVVLLGLWLLAWGAVSVGNVVSGILLITVLGLAFPMGRRREPRSRLHPIALVRLGAYLVVQLVVSTMLVAREIVTRRSRVRTGVVGYRIQQPSDLTLTIMSNILALSPGTMPVDATSDPPMLYVHFLLLSDVEKARRTIGKLESYVVAAIEPRATIDTVDGDHP